MKLIQNEFVWGWMLLKSYITVIVLTLFLFQVLWTIKGKFTHAKIVQRYIPTRAHYTGIYGMNAIRKVLRNVQFVWKYLNTDTTCMFICLQYIRFWNTQAANWIRSIYLIVRTMFCITFMYNKFYLIQVVLFLSYDANANYIIGCEYCNYVKCGDMCEHILIVFYLLWECFIFL